MEKIIGIDTSLFIYLFEENHEYLAQSSKIFRAIESGKYKGIFSVIGMIEILTGPKKKQQAGIAAEYEYRLRNFPNLSIIGINERIVWLSSDLRAKYGITTPDAIHIATAIDSGAKKFITNDKALKKIKEIKVEIL
jgi:predicted nucleic acid-binding protein